MSKRKPKLVKTGKLSQKLRATCDNCKAIFESSVKQMKEKKSGKAFKCTQCFNEKELEFKAMGNETQTIVNPSSTPDL